MIQMSGKKLKPHDWKKHIHDQIVSGLKKFGIADQEPLPPIDLADYITALFYETTFEAVRKKEKV